MIVPVVFLCAYSFLSSQDWQRVGTDYNATAIAQDGRIVVVGDYGGIMLSEDDGMTWNLPHSGTWSHLRSIRFRFRDALTGFAGGDSGTLLRTTDGGHTWESVSSSIRSPIRALDFPVATIGYGLADSGVMIRTSDGGEIWDTLANRLPGTGTGMRFINEERGVVVTAEGVIYRTETGGVQWEPVYTDSSLTFSGVAFNAPGILGYACTRERVILKTTDAGKTWEKAKELEPGLLPLCITVSESGNVYIGGHRISSENPDPFNAVAWSDDAGTTWKRPSLLITGFGDLALEGIAIRNERLAFAGNNGTVLIAGVSMDQTEQQPVSNSLLSGEPGGYGLPAYKVAFSGDTGIATVRVIGPSNTIFLRTTDGGISWQYATSPWIQNYLDIFGFPGGEFLVFSDNGGEVHKTTNVGKTWLPQGIAPTFPKPKSYRSGTFVDRERGYKTGDSLVYQTTDSGKTWQPRYFTGIEGDWSGWSIVTNLDFPSFEAGYAVFFTGEEDRAVVIRTTNAGETWQEVASRNGRNLLYDLHFVNQDRGFYTEGRQRENTGILFSTSDGGESWDSLVIENAVPFAVKFFDEHNGFVLGSPFFLMRTTDGGETWNREYLWPPEVDTSGYAFTDIALLPDKRTVVLIGNGVIARKTYSDKLVSVETERRYERPAGTLLATPNPASDRILFEWYSFGLPTNQIGNGKAVHVQLYDIMGRAVLQRAMPVELSGVVELDVSKLPAGTYRAVVEGAEHEVLAVQSVVIVR